MQNAVFAFRDINWTEIERRWHGLSSACGHEIMSVTAVLQSLRWLPVRQRITYKLCVLTHGVAFGYVPTYLRDAAVPLSTLPGRAHLRSADSGQYDVPWVSSSASSRAFSVAGPQAWNQLPASLRHTNCVTTFKTILFTAAYGVTDN